MATRPQTIGGNEVSMNPDDSSWKVSVVDAAPIPELGMILTLEELRGQDGCNVALYLAGSDFCHKVANVHFNPPNSTVQNIVQEISTLHLDGSEVVTSSRPPSAAGARFNDSLAMLSPVQSKFRLKSISNYAGNRANLLYENGSAFRLTLPSISTSSLVGRCLEAFSTYLPSISALDLYTRWYRVRHAPGPPSISCAEEWELFCHCLLNKIGYQVDKLKVNSKANTSIVSPVYSKKMKPSDRGSDCDWQNLLDSRIHQECGQEVSYLLNIGHEVQEPTQQPEETEGEFLINEVKSTGEHRSNSFVCNIYTLFCPLQKWHPICFACIWSMKTWN